MKYYIESTLNILGDETAIRHLMTMAQTTQTDFDLEQLVPITPHIIQIQAQNLDWEEEMKLIRQILQKYWSTHCVHAWILEEQLTGDAPFIKYALQTESDAPLHFAQHLSQRFPALSFVLKSEVEEYWKAMEWQLKEGKTIKTEEWKISEAKPGVKLKQGRQKQRNIPVLPSPKWVSKPTLKARLGLIMAQVSMSEHTIIERLKPEVSIAQNIHTALSQFWINHDFYTVEEVAQRFAIPPQYAVYLEKHGYINQNKGWRSLKAQEHSMLKNTVYSYSYFSSERKRYRAENKYPMMMIDIGGWSDKHWYFMSCDKDHHFGKVYEAYDTDFYDLPRIYEAQWADFFSFLIGEF